MSKNTKNSDYKNLLKSRNGIEKGVANSKSFDQTPIPDKVLATDQSVGTIEKLTGIMDDGAGP